MQILSRTAVILLLYFCLQFTCIIMKRRNNLCSLAWLLSAFSKLLLPFSDSKGDANTFFAPLTNFVSVLSSLA